MMALSSLRFGFSGRGPGAASQIARNRLPERGQLATEGAEMTRAGREPAEDLKRRFVAACEEVGLKVTNANMHLSPEATARVIHVAASVADWRHESPMLSIMATIPVTGQWPEYVEIRCCATDDDPVRGDCPWMKGRNQVPMGALVDELRSTRDEREQVIGAVKAGKPRPYRFEHTIWEPVDLLGALESF
jgi:hypothetical protein